MSSGGHKHSVHATPQQVLREELMSSFSTSDDPLVKQTERARHQRKRALPRLCVREGPAAQAARGRRAASFLFVCFFNPD